MMPGPVSNDVGAARAEVVEDVPMSTNTTAGSPGGELRGRRESSGTPSAPWRELLAIGSIVLLADLTLYRGDGYAGVAAFFLIGPALLLAGCLRARPGSSFWIVGTMLALLAIRTVWHGGPQHVVAGWALVIVFATVMHGYKPYVLTVLHLASGTVVAGWHGLASYLANLRLMMPRMALRGSLNIALPVAALVVFSTLFILANPDAASFVGGRLEATVKWVSDWLIQAAFRPTELLFWIAVAWISAGLLRPMLPPMPTPALTEPDRKYVESPLFVACKNTLVTVISLFAVYLLYEFFTLWTRDFPEGFYYAGYAHQGAAWLTLALALATLLLSLAFSGPNRCDPRLPSLKMLAWIWSIQNLLLSLAVFNRLFIYIDFNGMTRMRLIGLAGTATVVAGFLLVVVKIARGHNSLWLLRRQVAALAIAIYALILLPLDGIAATYNVRQVLRGNLSASMQLGVHKLDLEGILALRPLLKSEVTEIKEGVAALMAERYLALELQSERRQEAGWTALQYSDRVGLNRLGAVRAQWKPFEGGGPRAAAIQRFYNFAYQWY